jgi:hypothetical protein
VANGTVLKLKQTGAPPNEFQHKERFWLVLLLATGAVVNSKNVVTGLEFDEDGTLSKTLFPPVRLDDSVEVLGPRHQRYQGLQSLARVFVGACRRRGRRRGGRRTGPGQHHHPLRVGCRSPRGPHGLRRGFSGRCGRAAEPAAPQSSWPRGALAHHAWADRGGAQSRSRAASQLRGPRNKQKGQQQRQRSEPPSSKRSCVLKRGKMQPTKKLQPRECA